MMMTSAAHRRVKTVKSNTSILGHTTIIWHICTTFPLSSAPSALNHPSPNIMPLKITLIPTARMQTRATNKNSQPGLVDLSPSMCEARAATAKKTDMPTADDPAIRAAEEAHALQRVVELEESFSIVAINHSNGCSRFHHHHFQYWFVYIATCHFRCLAMVAINRSQWSLSILACILQHVLPHCFIHNKITLVRSLRKLEKLLSKLSNSFESH
jgi:hypothetical protein